MMHHEQPVCVRVTATEITASSPCFALKLTPPPPRRRQHTAGERPSILKTPSPTPLITSYQSVLSALPTPPPRAKKDAARTTTVQIATPFESPPTSPDVSLDTWTTPELSFDLSSSPDVSVDVVKTPDVFPSADTFHAVPCFVVLDSEDASETKSVPEPPRSPALSLSSSSSRKPPLPPVRPQPHSAKLTSGVKSRIASARRQYLDAQSAAAASQHKSGGSQVVLQDRFHRFCAQTEAERVRLAASVPDLPLEEMRRSPSPASAPIDRPHAGTSPSPSYRLKHPPVRPWPVPPSLAPISKSLGVLETDLDSEDPCTREVTNLDTFLSRTNSLMALRESRPAPDDRTRSMDFLLDGDNRTTAAAPENDLAARVKSEHELRVERSLGNLHLPEWYKRRPREGFLLGRDRHQERPASQHLRWTGLESRTPSSSSLAPPGSTVVPKRPDWRYVNSSRESLHSSTASPDSTSSTPFFSWTAYKAGRTQPYLGWRQAASVGSSAVPSPASSTPLSGSRPVSPGRWWQPNHSLHNQHHNPQPEPNDLKTEPAGIRNTMTRDRYSYVQSIYNGETPKFTSSVQPLGRTAVQEGPREEEGEAQEEKVSGGVFWMESSFVGSRSTTSVVVLPDEEEDEEDEEEEQVSVVEIPLPPQQQQLQQDGVRNGERPPHVPQQPFPKTKRGSSQGHCGGELSRSSTSERLGRFRCKVQ